MKAFTLIEMLLAVAICAIVLVAINGVFATAVRLRDKTAEAIEDSLPINRSFEILCRDLRGAVGPGGWFQGDFRCGVQAVGATMGLSGEAGSSGLDFFTTTGTLSDKAPWGDIQEVLYQLKAPSDRNQAGMELVRCVNRNVLATITQTPEIQYLMGGVQSLQFDCYDGTQWRNAWDTSTSDTNLPVAVLIRIQLVPKQDQDAADQQPLEMLVPLISQPREVATGVSTQ
ncbi:MAG TPA: type II secretion system protein GspJ [Candidatus Paceibacterota bacterium]|nr:type II secretion system protein GspJ [Verrucomicrobiota bacterium]HSA09950.1 type II secretion system protein GspJ [Candidatus Paceibacterota bacterium]